MKPCKHGHTSERYEYGACKECIRLRYKNNPTYRQQQVESTQRRRESNRAKWNTYARNYRNKKKAILVEYKGGKCSDCLGKFPIVCYDFDHREPSEKSFTIAAEMGKPIEELKKEAGKCDLVCRNCHAIRTSQSSKVSEKISKGLRNRRNK